MFAPSSSTKARGMARLHGRSSRPQAQSRAVRVLPVPPRSRLLAITCRCMDGARPRCQQGGGFAHPTGQCQAAPPLGHVIVPCRRTGQDRLRRAWRKPRMTHPYEDQIAFNPYRRVSRIVSAIQRGHYFTVSRRGRAVRPDACRLAYSGLSSSTSRSRKAAPLAWAKAA